VLGTLLGVVGVIFATPLTACAMVLVQRLYVEDALGDKLERPVRA
jgi:predicted PurR-regulated permease PerM